MTDSKSPGPASLPDRATSQLVADTVQRLRRCLDREPARWLLVDVRRQRLLLLLAERPLLVFPVSTAAAGIDGRAGSYGTPPGIHLIDRKIGDGQPAGAVFRERIATGQIWKPTASAPDDDLILSRILTLAGQETGINRGPDCDSLQRTIYIHGTNHEDRIGEPTSHGCIRLRNADIMELFDHVAEGDPVVIV
jgi:UDP-N-acetylmuramate--alanine ligase